MSLIQPYQFIEAVHTLDVQDDQIVTKITQEIPDAFLSNLSDLRHDTGREGDLMKVCSVPEATVLRWWREGFNIFKASAREIVTRLKAEDAANFLATRKRV